MEYPEIRLKYFDEAVSEGTITAGVNADVMVVHQKTSASAVNAFFRHGGKCLMSLDKNGAMLFFRHKWFYVPF